MVNEGVEIGECDATTGVVAALQDMSARRRGLSVGLTKSCSGSDPGAGRGHELASGTLETMNIVREAGGQRERVGEKRTRWGPGTVRGCRLDRNGAGRSRC